MAAVKQSGAVTHNLGTWLSGEDHVMFEDGFRLSEVYLF